MGSQEDFASWVRMSVLVMTGFSPCLGWGGSSSYMEEELNFVVAAQASYICLLQELLASHVHLQQMASAQHHPDFVFKNFPSKEQ